jgi:tetrapyrrole methylase family protein/MazG family protein
MTPGITVVGLGPGEPGLLTREAWLLLSESDEIYLRTRDHPVVPNLPTHIKVHSFDDLYAAHPSFEEVYAAIVDEILAKAAAGSGVVYAVPGDPMVGEATVGSLQDRAHDVGLRFDVVHGISFVEPCLRAIGVDALDGLSIADALALASRHHPSFDPDTPALVGQLYSRMVAADVKLTLLNQYPPDHATRLIHQAGTIDEVVEELPLHEVDRSRMIGSLTALYVPALPLPSSFESFQEIVAHLRAPEGCPWDREQTHQSLRTHLMEETYEALHALDEHDMSALREELGDLMLQVVLQTQIAVESDEFSMADVLSGIRAKLIRRHPHVFGDLRVAGVDEVLHNWEALKAAEREAGGGGKGALDGVPAGLPALAQAMEIQSRVARLGFDWPALDGVTAKVFEEIDEMLSAPDETALAAEIGDLLFSVVNFARWKDVDAEAALRQANARFRGRFARLEAASRDSGKPLAGRRLDEMDALWESAKGSEP